MSHSSMSEGWILGAECPHCERFAPAFPSPYHRWKWQMYCRCGVIFFTRQTCCRDSTEMTPEDWSHYLAVSSTVREYSA